MNIYIYEFCAPREKSPPVSHEVERIEYILGLSWPHSSHCMQAKVLQTCQVVTCSLGSGTGEEEEFFIDDLLVRIQLIIEMILVGRPCAMRF